MEALRIDAKARSAKPYREGGGVLSGKTSEEMREVVVKDAGPLGSESDARVDDNNDGQCRRCAMHTGHGEGEDVRTVVFVSCKQSGTPGPVYINTFCNN
jgi:hypothetical protein